MVKMSPSYHRNRRARIKLEMTREDFEKQRLQAAERKKRQRNNMNDEQKKATLAKEAESKRVKRKEKKAEQLEEEKKQSTESPQTFAKKQKQLEVCIQLFIVEFRKVKISLFSEKAETFFFVNNRN